MIKFFPHDRNNNYILNNQPIRKSKVHRTKILYKNLQYSKRWKHQCHEKWYFTAVSITVWVVAVCHFVLISCLFISCLFSWSWVDLRLRWHYLKMFEMLDFKKIFNFKAHFLWASFCCDFPWLTLNLIYLIQNPSWRMGFCEPYQWRNWETGRVKNPDRWHQKSQNERYSILDPDKWTV